ncbi:hypothetical protein RSAG8_05572, partial [Rhizoctonia solani AG-8 WAC10335]
MADGKIKTDIAWKGQMKEPAAGMSNREDRRMVRDLAVFVTGTSHNEYIYQHNPRWVGLDKVDDRSGSATRAVGRSYRGSAVLMAEGDDIIGGLVPPLLGRLVGHGLNAPRHGRLFLCFGPTDFTTTRIHIQSLH